MNPSSEPQAYGTGIGGTFDLIEFLKRPQVILRLVAFVCLFDYFYKWILTEFHSKVFAIIVFGSIAQEGYVANICRYNGSGACGYGIAIGVIAFLATIFFTAVDVYFQHISRAEVRKVVVLVELGVSGTRDFFVDENLERKSFVWLAVLLLLWFIGFCFMTDQWRREPNQDLPGWNGRNSVQAAIAFAFFSILVWVCLQTIFNLEQFILLFGFFHRVH